MRTTRPEQRLAFVSSRKSFSWFSFLVLVPRDHTLSSLIGSSIIVGAFASIMVYVVNAGYISVHFGTAMHSILGITLGLLLVIRTNTAYERWWEGRKLVSSMVNSCRALAYKFNVYLTDAGRREELGRLLATLPEAIKGHLREGVNLAQMSQLNDEDRQRLSLSSHVPIALLSEMTYAVDRAMKAGVIDGLQRLHLTRELDVLVDVVGSCERIKHSPLPLAYAIHLKVFILVFIITLPLGMVESFGWYTVPGLMLVFYAMAGLELIGEEIEDPFGTDLNDIPMDSIAADLTKHVTELFQYANSAKDLR